MSSRATRSLRQPRAFPQGAEGLAEIPDGQLEAVIESAEECPGECIYIEP
jgi:ferredoxin